MSRHWTWTTTLAAALLGVGALTVTTCAGPSAKPSPNNPHAVEKLIAACRQCPGDAEIARVAPDPEEQDFVRRIVALETTMTGHPLDAGNKVELLRDGPATHSAQLDAIAHAKDHVHLITYILTDDTLAHEYLKALSDRAHAGVKVRLMFDSEGSRSMSPEFRKALDDAGIEVREFGPINPLKSDVKDWETSHRNHRKILVVDGKVAFTGGINITDEYMRSSAPSGSGSGSGSGSRSGPNKPGWRDTHIKIEGPAVAQFQRLFFDSWKEDGQEPIPDSPRYWPELAPKGNSLVRAVMNQGNDLTDVAIEPIADLVKDSKGNKPANNIYASYIAAMTAAKKRIWITQAYFMPNEQFMDVLTAAARRGVDVRVLVPSQSDISMMVQASRFHYEPLLEAGARVYEYSGPMLHSKTAVIDSVWSTVGSSNLDFRSFIHNDEANAIVIGHDFAEQMEKMYLDDIANACEIQRDQWAHRSWTDRAKQRMSVLLKYWI